MDADRLEDARRMDGRYHAAKLVAAGFNDPPRIWDEHEEYKRLVLTQPDQTNTDELMRAGAELWKRALAKNMIPKPISGAN